MVDAPESIVAADSSISSNGVTTALPSPESEDTRANLPPTTTNPTTTDADTVSITAPTDDEEGTNDAATESNSTSAMVETSGGGESETATAMDEDTLEQSRVGVRLNSYATNKGFSTRFTVTP